MEKWPSTQIKLCDFGLSRVLTNQRLLEMSGTTDFLGKRRSFVRSSSLRLFRSSRSGQLRTVDMRDGHVECRRAHLRARHRPHAVRWRDEIRYSE